VWPRSDPISGGNVLRTPALRSPNYVLGVSGWTINQDGTAEFNDGTFRGSIEVGANPGQHFIVNNPDTGDVVDVYLSDGVGGSLLIYTINNDGATSIGNSGNTVFARMEDGTFQIDDGGMNASIWTFAAALDTHHDSFMLLECITSGAGYFLQLLSGSTDGTLKPTMTGTEQNITGSLVQSDQVSVGCLSHHADISGTTDVNGFLVFNHGAAFTPTKMYVQVHDVGGTPGFGMLDVIETSFTSTTAQVFAKNFNGTTRTSALIKFYCHSVR
jgi:hypothetical protein